MKYLTLSIFGLFCFSSALAQTLDIPVASFVNYPGGDYTLTAYPDGTGDIFDDCFMNGTAADATIKIFVRVNGIAAEGVDKERIRIRVDDFQDATHNRVCSGGYIYPDDHSDEDGYMYFSESSLPIYGQASSYNYYFIEYEEIENSGNFTRFDNGGNLIILTPDYNGDGEVDQIDLAAFAAKFYNSTYDLTADFNGDGLENTVDLAIFTAGYGTECP